MQKKAFTLIELAIVLTIIGLLIGGSFKVMKMMRERAKTAEAKELVLGAKNAVFGYAMQNYYLPENSEFDDNLSTVKDPNHPLLYVVDYELSQSDICAFTSTNLDVNNSGALVSDVAFVIIHEGPNYNMQTASSPTVVNIYTPSSPQDDNATPINIPEGYDDIAEWITLKQLKDEIGCVNKPFRFVTDKLPNAKVGVVYPSTSGTAKLEVENNISVATIACNPSSLYDINFTDPIFSGTPTTATTAEFECTATVDATNTNNQQNEITKKFVITIDPYLNRPEDANCTNDSECASGICVGGSCSSGVATDPCVDDGDCQSGICISNVCRSGAATEPCVDSGDCQSGLCVNSVCQTGAIGDACANNNQCQSGFCAGGVCTTGAFDASCDNDTDCQSGICQGGACSGYISDACTANSECLSGYCDANNTCASIPYDTNSTGGGSGGGGGGSGSAASCMLAGSPSVVNNNQTTTLSYSITDGPASGTFTPSGGSCTSFSNSTGGSCTSANLTRNTSFVLSISNAYGSGSCNTSVCVATRSEYRVRNDTGRRYFKVDGTCRRVNNNSEITTSSPLRRLNSGESIIQYSSTDSGCNTPQATMTFSQAVCADTDADGAVRFSGADY